MKIRLTTLLLIVSLLLLAGCSTATTPAADTTEDPAVTTTTPQTETDVPDAGQPEAESQSPAQTEAETSDTLTREEAIAVALNAASVTEADVLHIWAEYEIDDGVPEFEVEFRTADTEYDYTIHAETGAVLSWDQEVEHAAQMTETKPADTTPLTEAEAITIALTQAKLSEAEVSNLHVEYDTEDGDFEVEFYYNNLEYTYEIDAKTGTIRDSEIDD